MHKETVSVYVVVMTFFLYFDLKQEILPVLVPLPGISVVGTSLQASSFVGQTVPPVSPSYPGPHSVSL